MQLCQPKRRPLYQLLSYRFRHRRTHLKYRLCCLRHPMQQHRLWMQLLCRLWVQLSCCPLMQLSCCLWEQLLYCLWLQLSCCLWEQLLYCLWLQLSCRLCSALLRLQQRVPE